MTWINELHSHYAVPWAAVMVVSMTAAVTDMRSRRIPNWLTAPTVVVGLFYLALTSGVWGALDGVLGCVLLATPYVVLFLFCGGGAGDAKLMGAIGAWLGVRLGCVELIAVCICAALIGMIYAAWRQRLKSVGENIGMVSRGVLAATVSGQGLTSAVQTIPRPPQMLAMPYGLGIFVGTCVAATGVSLWQAMAH